MTRFRYPALREAAWARHYFKRGVTAADVLADERPPYPEDRLRAWEMKYKRVPLERKIANGR